MKFKIRHYHLLLSFLTGLFLRFLLAPYTITGDVVVFEIWAHEFVEHGYSNFYGWAVEQDLLIYGPGWIWLSSGFYKIWDSIFSVGELDLFHDFSLIFFMKLPVLLFDLKFAFLLFRFAEQINLNGHKAYMMWILNPFVIFVTAVVGQIDVIPLFFVFLSLLLLLSGRDIFAILSLGVGISFKSWPIILLPIFFILLYRKKGFFRSISNSAMIVVPFFLFSLPFLSSYTDFYNTYLGGHLQSPIINAFLYTNKVGPVPLAPILIIILLFLVVYSKFQLSDKNLYKIVFSILILPFIISIFNPYFYLPSSFVPSPKVYFFHFNWFIWLIPFLILYSLNRRHLKILFILLMIVGFAYSFSLFSTPIYFFSPIIEGIWTTERFPGDPLAWYIWPASKSQIYSLIGLFSRLILSIILVIFEIYLIKDVFPRFWNFFVDKLQKVMRK